MLWGQTTRQENKKRSYRKQIARKQRKQSDNSKLSRGGRGLQGETTQYGKMITNVTSLSIESCVEDGADMNTADVPSVEAVPRVDGEWFTASNTFKAYDRTRLRRPELGTTLLPLPARCRLRQVRMGLGHRASTLLGLLLLRRVSVPLHADARSRHPRSPTTAASNGGTADRRHQWRSLLFAEACLIHFNAVLWRVHEHRLRQTTGNGRRAVWLRVARFPRDVTSWRHSCEP